MKLVTFAREQSAREEVGVMTSGTILPVKACGLKYESMNELILHITPAERRTLQQCITTYEEKGSVNGNAAEIPLSVRDIRLLSPIPVPLQDILCLGLNYAAHADEAAAYSGEAFSGGKEAPVFFSKRVPYSQGTGDAIPLHEAVTSRLDYECELAVILGRDARHVKPEEAADFVFGYTILNDVSARDLQTTHKQWYFGKSLDGFSPMGPCIVTADEFAFPPALSISTTVNGEIRQSSSTGMLIHGIPEIIATLTEGMTLKAGTIIATGTPKGVAMGMEHPVFLKENDVVTCAIEGIGTLTNTIVAGEFIF